MELSDELTETLAEQFKLLADARRLSIVLAISDGPRSVSDVAESCGLSLSLVSHHLRLLRAAALARSERRGKQVFYAINDDHVRHMLQDMVTHITDCGDHAADDEENDHG